jgi:hypothetical protein
MVTEFSQIRQHLQAIGGFSPLEGEEFIPVSRRTVAKIEDAVGSKLPPAYKQFITIYGAVAIDGFAAIHPVAPVPDRYLRKGRIQFTAFFGAKSKCYDEFYSIEWQMEQMSAGLPERTIPIANAASSNICLQIGSSGEESILLADADLMQDIEKSRGKPKGTIQRIINSHYHLIAHSFLDLVLRISNVSPTVGR